MKSAVAGTIVHLEFWLRWAKTLIKVCSILKKWVKLPVCTACSIGTLWTGFFLFTSAPCSIKSFIKSCCLFAQQSNKVVRPYLSVIFGLAPASNSLFIHSIGNSLAQIYNKELEALSSISRSIILDVSSASKLPFFCLIAASISGAIRWMGPSPLFTSAPCSIKCLIILVCYKATAIKSAVSLLWSVLAFKLHCFLVRYFKNERLLLSLDSKCIMRSPIVWNKKQSRICADLEKGDRGSWPPLECH